MKKIIGLIIAVMLFATGCTAALKTTEEQTAAAINKESMEKSEQMDKDTDETMDKSDDMAKDDDKMMEDNPLDVTLMDLNGNEWNLAKLGTKANVKVWASWCSICLSGLGEHNDLTKNYTDGKIVTVVSPGRMGEKNKDDFVEWFKGLDDYEDIVVLLDEDGVIVNELGIRGFPTYVYLDSKGQVDSVAIGHRTTEDIVNTLQEIS